MNIELKINNSDRNVINKSITDGVTLTGTLKEECSVVSPIITVESDDSIFQYNYLYIPGFCRYYFIDNITIISNDLFRLECSVDVLESFKTPILSLECIIENSSNKNDKYLLSDIWKTRVKTSTTILNFPSGLNDNGEYILITAGG